MHVWYREHTTNYVRDKQVWFGHVTHGNLSKISSREQLRMAKKRNTEKMLEYYYISIKEWTGCSTSSLACVEDREQRCALVADASMTPQ